MKISKRESFTSIFHLIVHARVYACRAQVALCQQKDAQITALTEEVQVECIWSVDVWVFRVFVRAEVPVHGCVRARARACDQELCGSEAEPS